MSLVEDPTDNPIDSLTDPPPTRHPASAPGRASAAFARLGYVVLGGVLALGVTTAVAASADPLGTQQASDSTAAIAEPVAGVDDAARGAAGLVFQAGQSADSLELTTGVISGSSKALVEGLGALADGSSAAKDGAVQLADGAVKLDDGANALADGSRAAFDGSKALADGAGKVDAGAHALADGSKALADGSKSLAAGAGELAKGAGTLAEGAGAAAAGAKLLADGAGSAEGAARFIATGVVNFDVTTFDPNTGRLRLGTIALADLGKAHADQVTAASTAATGVADAATALSGRIGGGVFATTASLSAECMTLSATAPGLDCSAFQAAGTATDQFAAALHDASAQAASADAGDFCTRVSALADEIGGISRDGSDLRDQAALVAGDAELASSAVAVTDGMGLSPWWVVGGAIVGLLALLAILVGIARRVFA